MIKPLSLSQVAEFCRESLQATLKNGDATFSSINTDTRTLVQGELFIALRGENFDAHQFLQQAVEKGVCGLVVEKFDEAISIPQLVVTDSLLALGKIAAMNRNAFSGPLLAITGSSGKTTVKTMLADILNECGSVLATKGNFNNHIGVPLTLLKINKEHEFAVIEMGASALGEIAYLCDLAKPQVSMVNNVMPAHIEGFGSIEGVAKAKGEIFQQLPSSGTAVINIDDAFSPLWLEKIDSSVVRVSLHNNNADCFAKNIAYNSEGSNFLLVMNQQEVSVRLPALGEHSIRNALMSAAMAFSVGATLYQIKQGLENFSPVSGRMKLHVGISQAQIIDDSYNANPGSVRAAIDALSAQQGIRILVLGDLGELGQNAAQLHAELGSYANDKIDELYTLGVLTTNTHQSYQGKNKEHFNDRNLLVEKLKKIATSTSIILIKGSRSAKMDLVVDALCVTGEQH